MSLPAPATGVLAAAPATGLLAAALLTGVFAAALLTGGPALGRALVAAPPTGRGG